MSNTQQQIETAYLTGLRGAADWANQELARRERVKTYEKELVALTKTSIEPTLQEMREHHNHGGRVETCDNCHNRFMAVKRACNICCGDFCLPCMAVHAPYCALLRSMHNNSIL